MKIEEEIICGYCKKRFDEEHWIKTECCVHCGAFLDNPPYVYERKELKKQKELLNAKTN